MSHEHHVPQFHIRLPRGYLNDPNGPIDIDGRIHLYFQSRPRVDLGIPVEWGHATSDDLVRWVLHRPAIVPIPGGADSGGAWSGNTVRHDGQIRAYYSGKVDDNEYQSVLMAAAAEDGAAFGPPIQVVADPGADEGITMFRDPFVWKIGDNWEMGVGAAEAGETATIRRYRSSDGLKWEPAGFFASLGRSEKNAFDTGEGWECPQFLRIDDTEIAVVSAWSHTNGPGDVFAFALGAEIRPEKVDEGSNFYAASVMRESQWGPVLFGWITEGRDAAWAEDAGWSGAISLPRNVWLDEGRLCSGPHPAIDALRVGAGRVAHAALIGAQAEIVLPEAESGTIRLCFAPDEFVEVHVDVDRNTVTIDRGHASTDVRAHGGVSTAWDAFDSSASRPALRLFIDGSVVEAFTSAGRVVTTRVYPTHAPPWTIEAPPAAVIWSLRASVGPGLTSGIESRTTSMSLG